MTRRRPTADLTGPFRGSEAIASGALSRAQLRSPLVRRLFRGVYLPAATPVTHEIKARAATLVIPGSAVVTGLSAAAVRGVDLVRPDDPVEVAVPESCRFGPVRGLHVVRTAVRPDESRPWEGARLATPARAGFDALRHQSLPWAVGTLDALLRAGVVESDELARLVDGRLDTGVGTVRTALGMADVRAESPPESVVRVLLALADLHPTPQLPVTLADGRIVRVDLGFARSRVAVEYDGAWHALRGQLERDRSRHNALQAAGWTLVVVTAADLRKDPRILVATVRAALDRRAA
ncbi:DUF559 domain-containing protein [Rhodococcus aerolatus]